MTTFLRLTCYALASTRTSTPLTGSGMLPGTGWGTDCWRRTGAAAVSTGSRATMTLVLGGCASFSWVFLPVRWRKPNNGVYFSIWKFSWSISKERSSLSWSWQGSSFTWSLEGWMLKCGPSFFTPKHFFKYSDWIKCCKMHKHWWIKWLNMCSVKYLHFFHFFFENIVMMLLWWCIFHSGGKNNSSYLLTNYFDLVFGFYSSKEWKCCWECFFFTNEELCTFTLMVFFVSGAVAGTIDIGTRWMTDLRFGICPEAFWFNKEQCCWSSDETHYEHDNCSKVRELDNC